MPRYRVGWTETYSVTCTAEINATDEGHARDRVIRADVPNFDGEIAWDTGDGVTHEQVFSIEELEEPEPTREEVRRNWASLGIAN